MKKLQIRIYPDGKIETKTLGVKGSACEKYLDTFEKLTKAQIVDSEYAKEFLETESVLTQSAETVNNDTLENYNV